MSITSAIASNENFYDFFDSFDMKNSDSYKIHNPVNIVNHYILGDYVKKSAKRDNLGRQQRERDEAGEAACEQEENRKREEQVRLRKKREEAYRAAREQEEIRKREEVARAIRQKEECRKREEQVNRQKRILVYPAANFFADQPLGEKEADIIVTSYLGVGDSVMYGRVIAEGLHFRGNNFDNIVVIPSDKWKHCWASGDKPRPPIGTGLFRVVGKNRADPFDKEKARVMLAFPKNMD